MRRRFPLIRGGMKEKGFICSLKNPLFCEKFSNPADSERKKKLSCYPGRNADFASGSGSGTELLCALQEDQAQHHERHEI